MTPRKMRFRAHVEVFYSSISNTDTFHMETRPFRNMLYSRRVTIGAMGVSYDRSQLDVYNRISVTHFRDKVESIRISTSMNSPIQLKFNSLNTFRIRGRIFK